MRGYARALVNRGVRIIRALLSLVLIVAVAGVAPVALATSAPPNDAFAAAQVLSGATGSIAGTTVGATHEAGETGFSGDASVWYTFTPAVSGGLKITARNTSGLIQLQVFRGSTVASLTQLALQLGSGATAATAWIAVSSGTTYRVRVSSAFVPQQAAFTLAWDEGPVFGAVSGRVTSKRTGAPITGIVVGAAPVVRDAAPPVTTGLSDAQGYYTIQNLPAGSYRVGAEGSDDYLGGRYPSLDATSEGTPVAVSWATTTTGIDCALRDASHIRGHVSTLESATPVAAGKAVLYSADLGGTWEEDAHCSFDASGAYEFDGLEPGTYRVAFVDQAGARRHTFYPGVSTLESATDVPVSEGATAQVDQALALASHITGTVLEAGTMSANPDARVWVFRRSDGGAWEDLGWLWPDEQTGAYSIGGLWPGIYRLRFDALDPTTPYMRSALAFAYFHDASSLASATDVVVGSEATVAGIDAYLPAASHLSGRITDPYSRAGVKASVTAYLPDGLGGWRSEGSVDSAADGTYSFAGLAGASYRLEFIDQSGAHVSRTFDDVAVAAESTRNYDVALMPLHVPTPTSWSLSGPTSVKQKKAFKLSGKIKPLGAGGSVTVTFQRLIGKNWKVYATVKKTLVAGAFSASYTPKYRGSWRAVVTYAGQSPAGYQYLASSATKAFKVK